MSGLFYEFLLRAVVMSAVLGAFGSIVWFVLQSKGLLKPAARVRTLDFRTWELQFVLIDAAVFGIVFSGLASLLGPSLPAQMSSIFFAVLTALLTPYLLPVLAK